MIRQTTIDKVNDIPVEAVIEKYITLTKKGATLEAKSPFTDEKTPSFKVSPAKGVWKCFSTHKGGNSGIKFVREFLGIDHFPDVITEIAGQFNIEIEYDDSDKAKENQKIAAEKSDIVDINNLAWEFFFEEESNKESLLKVEKRLTKTQIDHFGVGFANKQFKSLLQFLVGKGVSEQAIVNAGLASKKDKGTFDFFNNRIIFPIHNHQKKIIGFGGRGMDGDKIKYINTKETKLYNKSEALYGIHLAKEEIRLVKKANLVEGYYDVAAMHFNQMPNTVSPCGTALTEDQAKLLKRWCDAVRLIFDADAPGIKAARKAVELLLPLDFKVEVCFLPEGEDPDSIFRNKEIQKQIEEIGGIQEYFDSLTQDGVEWLTALNFEDTSSSIIKQSKAQALTEKLISSIPDARLRTLYIKSICTKYGVSKTEIEKGVKTEILTRTKALEENDGPKLKLPKGANKEDYDNYNFVEVIKEKSNLTGYHFPKTNSQMVYFEQVSNFVITPLFHIYSKSDNKRLIKIKNKGKAGRIIDISSKAFVSFQNFQEAVIDEGNYLFYGSPIQFKKVVMKIMEKFPTCEEIKTFGWQKQGFYAFADGIATNTFKKVDVNGIIEFDKHKYFLPAFSDAYKNVREDDDLYENQRHFIYKKAPVSFERWAKQFDLVHGYNGKMGISFFIATIFKDVVYNLHKVFPLLFGFGTVGTGKSYFARSIHSIFHGNQQGFNLNSGTDVAFNAKMAQFRNATAWYDEYTNEIDLKRFQAMKGSFDGFGREKGTKGNDNRTISVKINSSVITTGQYYPTRDDNSLYTRSIVCTFDRKSENLTSDEIKLGATLKAWENEGLSSLIVDVLKYRDYFESNFIDAAEKVTTDINKELKGVEFDGRVRQNFVLIITCVKILEDKITFPFTYTELESQAIKMIIKQSAQISDSDALRSFWKIMEFLLMEYKIRIGEDFKIQQVNSINLKVDRSTEIKNFKQPKKLLFVRFSRIHPLYMEAHRKQHGENGVAETSIKSYMSSNKAFVGLCPATQFEGAKTSAYVFDYEMLGINLEIHPASKHKSKPKETGPFAKEPISEKKDEKLPF